MTTVTGMITTQEEVLVLNMHTPAVGMIVMDSLFLVFKAADLFMLIVVLVLRSLAYLLFLGTATCLHGVHYLIIMDIIVTLLTCITIAPSLPVRASIEKSIMSTIPIDQANRTIIHMEDIIITPSPYTTAHQENIIM